MCPAACAAVCGSGLTRRAVKGSYEAFDLLAGHPVLRCVKPGLVETLSCIGAHPVEFVRRGDGDIVLRIESDDNVRIILTGEDTAAAGAPPSPRGDAGRIRFSWSRRRASAGSVFKIRDLVSAPRSSDVRRIERFTLDARWARSAGDSRSPTRQRSPRRTAVAEWLSAAHPIRCDTPGGRPGQPASKAARPARAGFSAGSAAPADARSSMFHLRVGD